MEYKYGTDQSYYRFDKSERTGIAEVCAWAIEAARSAEEFASVARLIAGAGLTGVLGPMLEVKILEHLESLHMGNRRSEALADAHWIGVALEILQRPSPK